MIPYSTDTEATFENFIAICPICGFRNTFNRASDLQTFEPIDYREVVCQKCFAEFAINNDVINAAHEMLLIECHEFLERKLYMQCVLNVTQAYEVFFSHLLYVRLAYRPYATEGSCDLPRLNRLIGRLYDRVRSFSYR